MSRVSVCDANKLVMPSNSVPPSQKLTADGRMKLKRNLMYVDDGPFYNCSHHLLSSQQVSKRVCRNLTAEFCSDFSETSAASEPNLDLWVLRTLGLKDRDTIDTSDDSSSPSGLGGLVYDAADTSPHRPPSSSEYASKSSSVAASTPPSIRSCCQSSTRQTEYSYSAAGCQEANKSVDPAVNNSALSCTSSPDQRSDLTAGLSGPYDAPAAVISSYNSLTAFRSPLTEETTIRSITASGQSQPLDGNPADHSAYWSPLRLRGNRTPSQDTIQFSPSGERVHFSPISSSSPVTNHQWTPVRGHDRASPSAGSQPPATPQTPRSRTELAFSMSLSPSSSVKTHSFPQGQAFVRKDTEGRWNFTWVPRQGP